MNKELQVILGAVQPGKQQVVETAVNKLMNSKLLGRGQQYLMLNRKRFGKDIEASLTSGNARTRRIVHYVRKDISTAGTQASVELLNSASIKALGEITLQNGKFENATQVESIGVRLSAEQASTVVAAAAAYSNVAPGTGGRPALNGDIVGFRSNGSEVFRFNVAEFFAEAAAAVEKPVSIPLQTPQPFAPQETLVIKLETGAGTMQTSTNKCFIEVRVNGTEILAQG